MHQVPCWSCLDHFTAWLDSVLGMVLPSVASYHHIVGYGCTSTWLSIVALYEALIVNRTPMIDTVLIILAMNDHRH